MIDHLAACKKVLLTTHARPDGDAIGTVVAMSLGLKAKGIDSVCVVLTPVPFKLEFVHEAAGVTPVLLDGNAADLLGDCDAFLACDTGTWSQLEGFEQAVGDFAGKKLVLDHHRTQQDWADYKLVDTTAGAAAEVAMELLRRWDVKITPAMATAMYVAMATDTGWFGYSNTTPRTMRHAADCLEAGVDIDDVFQRLNQAERKEKMRLHARAHESMELIADDRVAVSSVSLEDFEQTGTKSPATEDIINWPMAIKTVRASIFLAANPDTADGLPTKVSFRSKGDIDCSQLAEQFGGGGHARAAGARLDLPLDEARKIVVEATVNLLTKTAGV